MCLSIGMIFCFFFFKQKTAYEMRISDWSSDVCSSDLVRMRRNQLLKQQHGYGFNVFGHALYACGPVQADSQAIMPGARTARGGQVSRALEGTIGRASCRERVCQDV